MKVHHYYVHGDTISGFPCPVEWCNRRLAARSIRQKHVEKHPEKHETIPCPTCGVRHRSDSLGHHLNGPCEWPPINDETADQIVGLVLGDASVTRNQGRNAAVSIQMTQRPFLEWISDEFGWLATDVRLVRTSEEAAAHAADAGLPETSGDADLFEPHYGLNLRNHPRFNEMRERFYPGGEKRFPRDLELTPEITRMWYVCDGGLQQFKDHREPMLQFSTRNEVDRLDWIAEKFQEAGFTPAAHGDHAIQFGKAEAKRLLRWMGDSPPGFQHKWD